MLTLRGWRNDILSGWEDTENNSDYRSKTELDLITKVVGSEDKAKMSMIQNYRDKLNALKTPLKQVSKVRNDIRYMPEWIRDDVAPFYISQEASGSDANLRNARVTHREDNYKDARKLTGNLSLEVSGWVHTDDALRLAALGKEIHIDPDTGRFATAEEGALTPAFAIADPELSLTEEYLLYDSRDIWKEKVDELLFQSQKLAQEADDNVTNAMWAKLTSASIPDEFRPGIVVDMAEKNGWNT